MENAKKMPGTELSSLPNIFQKIFHKRISYSTVFSRSTWHIIDSQAMCTLYFMRNSFIQETFTKCLHQVIYKNEQNTYISSPSPAPESNLPCLILLVPDCQHL
jgi:hypothetical protein